MFQYSLFTNAKNKLLSKTYTLNESGEIDKLPSGEMTAGAVTVKSSSIIDFIKTIEDLPSNQAISFGIPSNGLALNQITTAAKQSGTSIARTKANFSFPEGSAFLHIDYDPDRDRQYINNVELHEILCGIIPALKECQRVVVRSNSSRVFKKGWFPTNFGGYHIYYGVERGSDIPAIAKYINMALACNGHCYIKISKSGAALVRCIVDTAVWSQERLIFIGAPVVGVGLEISPKIISANTSGGLLKLIDLEDYSSIISRGEQVVADLKESTRDERYAILSDNAKSTLIYEQNQAREQFKSCKTLPVSLSDIALDRHWVLNTRELGLITLHEALRAGYEQLNCSDIYDLNSSQTRTVLYVNGKKSAFIHTFDDGGSIIDVSAYLLAEKDPVKSKVVATVENKELSELNVQWGHTNMAVTQNIINNTTGSDFEAVRISLGIQYSYDKDGREMPLQRHYSALIIRYMLYDIALGKNAIISCIGEKNYLYNGKYHEPMTCDEVMSMCASHLSRHGTKNYYISQFIDKWSMAKNLLFVGERWQYSRKNVTINLNNNTLVIADGAFDAVPHSPETCHYSVEDYDYDPDAKAVLFESVVNEVLPDQALRKTYQMAIGSILAGDKCNHILICEGKGSNGKSLLLDTIGIVLGNDNTMHVTLENLLDERGYHLPGIKSKRLCIIEEMEGAVTNKGLLKSLITKDKTMCRPIGQKPELLEDYASFIGNSNNIGGFSVENTEAWARRIIVVPFLVEIPAERRDKTLKSRLLLEKAGILNWILDGYRMYVENEYKIMMNDLSKTAIENTLDNSCSVKAYLDEGCSYITGDGGMRRTEQGDLFVEYQKFCATRLFQQHKGRNKFFHLVNDYGYWRINSCGKRFFYKDVVF